MNAWVWIINPLAGGTIGLVLGLMVGMSVSKVVASVVGAVTAGAIAFVGLRAEPIAAMDAGVAVLLPQLRVASFALGCLAGLLGGVYIRARDVLGESIRAQVKGWESAGFSVEEARKIVLFLEAGIVPPGWSVAKKAPTQRQGRSLLYGAGSDLSAEIEPEKFANVAEVLQTWAAVGGRWKMLAELVTKEIAPAKQDAVVKSLHRILCSTE